MIFFFFSQQTIVMDTQVTEIAKEVVHKKGEFRLRNTPEVLKIEKIGKISF